MPPSQLKRLKASLREQGITGPQRSKKQKKGSKGNKIASDRIQRDVALQQIRESFNPFEFKAASRPAKFQHASSTTTNGAGNPGKYKAVLHRPGVTKSAGEDMRRAKLLPEMQRRNKVGGLVDRRIGEGDPGMTAEERAVQRFAQEKQRRKGASTFDLEASDDDEPRVGLTHGGRSLDDLPADEFSDGVSDGEEDMEDGELMHRKRRRSDDEQHEEEDAEQQPELKKSKKEVMHEVIAKSKLHKYERQKAKEDDDELRDELDSGLNDMLALLRAPKARADPPKAVDLATTSTGPTVNPDRQKLLDGMDRSLVDRQYDARLKQLAQDMRAKPSERTKTQDEKIKEEAETLKMLEERRLKRMQGEDLTDDEEAQQNADADDTLAVDDDVLDEAAQFGFTSSNAHLGDGNEHIVLDDEDEFALDEDLIANNSDVDLSDVSESDLESEHPDEGSFDQYDEEDEFVKGILGKATTMETKSKEIAIQSQPVGPAYTYPCPRSHHKLLETIKDTPVDQLPTIIQRIRALHHPSLSAANRDSMADFSATLVDHLDYMGLHKQPLHIAEQVIRHLHSLSRTYPEHIGAAFRRHLQTAYENKDLHAGDLMLLTAIGSIYPTSDHFHQVVTPATTIMARWLDTNIPDTDAKHNAGVFLVALCIKFQTLSKRYIPEAMRFTLKALLPKSAMDKEQKKAHIENLLAMANLWKEKTAFIEIFHPGIPLLQRLNATRELQTLTILMQQSRIRRRPLELHHHRPLPIRTSVPKFEEGFNPDKHYDPDKERSEAKKLQKEYQRERKGALRELRKDANFIARQQLSEKRARDAEYEKKYRRLVAEIQGEEGHEAKEYEKEKRKRKHGR